MCDSTQHRIVFGNVAGIFLLYGTVSFLPFGTGNLSKRNGSNVEKEKDNVALIYDLVSGTLTVRFEVSKFR